MIKKNLLVVSLKRILKSIKRFLALTFKLFRSFKLVALSNGYFKSIINEIPLSKEGSPLPWYTYSAINFLQTLDLSDCVIFEYGSGQSSLFFSALAKKVVSVEHDPSWFNKMKDKLKDNNLVFLETEKNGYVQAIAKEKLMFDIIVVDGEHRLECLSSAREYLKDGGMIILDNSDWLPECVEKMRSMDMIEVNFSGPGPINDYNWETSVFFSRSFNLKKINKK